MLRKKTGDFTLGTRIGEHYFSVSKLFKCYGWKIACPLSDNSTIELLITRQAIELALIYTSANRLMPEVGAANKNLNIHHSTTNKP
jgi:hypothetical protein